MTRIENENVRLRSASLDDAKTLARWWNDGKVMEHAGFPNGLSTSVDKVAKNISSFCVDPQKELLIIEIDNQPVGEMSFRVNDGAAYPGWKICEDSFQNKGYGPIVIRMLFNYLFTHPNFEIEKIIWDTMLENTRAQHVYEEKIKARKIDTQKNAFVDQLGRNRTAVVYELRKDKFDDPASFVFDWERP